jgi:hypothetical protein
MGTGRCARENLENLSGKKTQQESLYGVNVKFVPEVIPESEESEVLRAGREDRAVNGTIPHGAINWD